MKLLLIEWTDSHSHRGSPWRTLEEIQGENGVLRCLSVGWAVAESKKAVTLVPHIFGEQDDVEPCGCGELCIPRKAILSIKVLRNSKNP